MLKQGQNSPLSATEQVVSLFAGTRGFLDQLRVDSVARFEKELLEHLKKYRQDILDDIESRKEITRDSETRLAEAIREFGEAFVEDSAE